MAGHLIEQQVLEIVGVHGLDVAVQVAPNKIEVSTPSNLNNPAISIEEPSFAVVTLNEFPVCNDGDNIYSNDTVIHNEEVPSSLAHGPVHETYLATGSNDNINNNSALEHFLPRIWRWFYSSIPNLRVSVALAVRNLFLKMMIDSETDLEDMLFFGRLGSFRFYRLPLSYSVSTSCNNDGYIPPSHYIEFGIAVEYKHRMASLIFGSTQNTQDLLQRNGYSCLMCLGSFDVYIQYFNLWWNESSENSVRLPRLHLTTTEE